jgi:hypothetical protein
MPRFLPVALVATILWAAVPHDARAASALTPAQIHELLTSPDRRVRGSDPRIERLIAEGLRRSTTFGDLVVALNRSNVIVYIQKSMTLPSMVSGRTLLTTRAHGQRYLRVQVRLDLPAADVIALIGHELRHAIEIAENPDVVDQSSMVKLYERIGHRADRQDHFDTAAAREAQRQVRIEL